MIRLGKAQPRSSPKARRLRGLIEWLESRVDGSTVCCGRPGMTTPAKASSASYVVQRLRFRACLLAAGLALAVPLVGCDLFHSNFDVAVGNRTANPISIFVNGGKIGDVGSNLTGTFTVEETPIGRTTVDSTGSPTSPGPIAAQVTFSAQDMTTGVLSAGVAATLVKDITTYVDVAPCVPSATSDAGSAAPCVSVTSASVSTSSGTTGSQGQACTFSLSGSGQSFTATGGTGSVTVTTSSDCTWSATSSESWLTVVSGSPGTGAGVVMFRVAANTTGQARAASLTIGGQTFTVNQSAA